MDLSLDSKRSDNRSARRTARLAAFLFLFICAPVSFWSNYVSSRIFVALDPGATANNLLANEFLFRSAIVTHLASFLVFAFVIMLFSTVFSAVDKPLSRLMVAPVIAQIAVFLILEVFNFAALMILKSETQFAFDDNQKQELSYLFLRMHRYGIGASQILLGACFIPFGLLAYRSQFIPRIFAVLLILTGICYVADTCTYFLLQRSAYLSVQPFIKVPMNIGYVAMIWFLIKGVPEQRPTAFS